jgi:hypothetical protein
VITECSDRLSHTLAGTFPERASRRFPGGSIAWSDPLCSQYLAGYGSAESRCHACQLKVQSA